MIITVSIPCYRSEKNIRSVVQEIKDEFQKRPEYDYQIILVCDGSPDHTDQIIRELCEEDKKIMGILLSRNFTQVNAKMAALPYVKGDVLIYMDDDGQHPPADIFRLCDKICEGYDIVYAYFPQKEQSKFKIWTSDLFGKINEKMGKRPRGIHTSSFLAYSRFAVNQLKNYRSPSPSSGGYLYSITTRITNIISEQRRRISGQSGYTFAKMVELAVSSWTNFTIVPLRIIDYTGFITAFLGIIYGFYLVIKKLFYKSVVPGYTSNTVLLLILGGLILVSLGIVGEYVGRMYMLLSDKPQYVIREIINHKEEQKPQD